MTTEKLQQLSALLSEYCMENIPKHGLSGIALARTTVNRRLAAQKRAEAYQP